MPMAIIMRMAPRARPSSNSPLLVSRAIAVVIVLETGKGDFETGFALGIVLLFIAFIVNWALILLRRKS